MKTVGAVATSIAAPAIVKAQTTFDFTIGSSHPLSSIWIGPMKTVFQKEVEQRAGHLGFKISWREAYGGTLYNFQDTLAAVRNNLVDVGWVGTIWEAKALPLSNLTYYAPFASNEVVPVVEAIDRLTTNFKPMTDGWTGNNAVCLGSTGVDTAHLWTKFPVKRVEDLSGRKFSTAGLAANFLKGTGALVFNSAQTNFYNDINSGITEGVMTAGTVVHPTRAYEIAKHFTRVGGGAMSIGAIAMNKTKFDTLPPPLQLLIRGAGREFARSVALETMGRSEALVNEMIRAGNIEANLPPDEREKWIASIPDLGLELARTIPDLPVKEAIRSYLAEVRKAGGGKPARDWAQD